jgi:hypothetical protein
MYIIKEVVETSPREDRWKKDKNLSDRRERITRVQKVVREELNLHL